MKSRRFMLAALLAGLFGLANGGIHAQDKDKEKAEKEKADKEKLEKVKATEEQILTVDGVKLRGVFYSAVEPKNGAQSAPCVLILHAYGANPDEAAWDDTAKLLASKGIHVMRFDFRGHGKSKDIVADDFWAHPINKQLVKYTGNPSLKTAIDKSDFKLGYYPMLVQDIAAVRIHLDKKNDNGLINSSSIYLLGTGDAMNLGLFFTATEWLREQKRPNSDIINLRVSPTRQLFPGFDPAGPDIRGAIWLSPAAPPATVCPAAAMNQNNMKSWVISPYALKLRMETQMLFVYGKKDSKSESFAHGTLDRILMVDPKDMDKPKKDFKPKTYTVSGQQLPNPDQTYIAGIKDSAAIGTKLLNSGLGTEGFIEQFIKAVEELRQMRERTNNRGWLKPLLVDIQAFGAWK